MDRTDLPWEAVSINGEYIEDAISGYTTISTSGREGLSRELNTFAVGAADGETYKGSRVPARTIKVEFALHGSSLEDVRSKLNHLNNILAQDDADFVFNDESGMFWTGYTVIDETFKTYTNAVTGSFTIYCTYPFKRSVAPVVLSSTDAEGVVLTGNTATFTFDYDGTYPARPLLQAQFASALDSDGNYDEDGDCGYVAFMDEDENIIQLGNPDAIDLDAYAPEVTLINKKFQNKNGWSNNGGKTWGNHTIDGSTACGNITDTYWNKGAGSTTSLVKPTHVTGTTGWHGPTLYKNTTGAINFEVTVVHRLAVKTNEEVGCFECGLYNTTDNKMVAGYVIYKTSSGTKGTVKYIVNGKEVGKDTIDLSYYNTNFGYCQRTPVYTTQKYTVTVTKNGKKTKETRTREVRSGWKYTQSNLNSQITKSGSTVRFKIGKLAERSFTNTDIELMPAHRVSFHFGRNGDQKVLHTNAVRSVRFRNNSSIEFANNPNVFTAGDIVEADCNDATVYLMHEDTIEGHTEPQLGALGNDWEDFVIRRGTNVITAVWSDWVNANYAPTIRIIFNEVYL